MQKVASLFQFDFDGKMKTKWRVSPVFIIKLHIKDIAILEEIKYTLVVGKIRKYGTNSVQFVVESIKDLQIIVDHFDKYQLITAKVSDYLLFKQIVSIMQLKEHLTLEGLQKIINIKATLNFGLSEELQLMFPETIPIPRPLALNEGRETLEIPHSQWIAGFASAEGSFSVSLDKDIFKSLLFKITQHKIDEVLLTAIKEYFNCGYCYLRKKENTMDFKVTKFSDITEIIIPFFINNPILSVKSLDFKDLCLVTEIVKKREHKLEENILKIKEIQKGMNRGRSF